MDRAENLRGIDDPGIGKRGTQHDVYAADQREVHKNDDSQRQRLIAQKSVPGVRKLDYTQMCPYELGAANTTLTKSREVADTILTQDAKTDLVYWFARLYHYITFQEISDRGTLTHPCFLLHFIPVFYDSYLVAVEAFRTEGKIPNHWQAHFSMNRIAVDPSHVMPWISLVTKTINLGVEAHIKTDMAFALESAYRSFTAKYNGVPSFDTFKPDFFTGNLPIFRKVRLSLINELVNRGLGFNAMRANIRPNFPDLVARRLNIGLNTDEIYKWRQKAWDTAKASL